MNPADDPSHDGALQRLAVLALEDFLRASGFAGGILVAITPDARVVPVMALPYDKPVEVAVELLRTTLAQVEGGHYSSQPRPLDPPNG